MKKLFQWVVWVLNGCVLGVAGIIPGLSVGTLAVVMGLYEKIIHSLLQVYLPANWPFLLCIICGFGGVFFTLSKGISYLIQFHYLWVYSFFTGLILASLPYLFKKISQTKKSIVLMLVSGSGFFGLSFYIPQVASFQTLSESIQKATHSSMGDYLGVYFLSGLISCFFAVFPGVSGSLVLVFLGTYYLMLQVLSEWLWLELVIFLVGGLMGLMSACFCMRFLFSKYQSLVYAVICGFVVGNTVGIFPWHESVSNGIFSIFKALQGLSMGAILWILIDKFLKKNLRRKI